MENPLHKALFEISKLPEKDKREQLLILEEVLPLLSSYKDSLEYQYKSHLLNLLRSYLPVGQKGKSLLRF
jgi:hypothetical protein